MVIASLVVPIHIIGAQKMNAAAATVEELTKLNGIGLSVPKVIFLSLEEL